MVRLSGLLLCLLGICSLAWPANIPLSFEPNQGQFSRAIDFQARTGGRIVQLGAGFAKVAMGRHMIKMRFSPANRKIKPEALAPLPGKANYFLSADARNWRTNVPTYQRVRYRQIYDGIDLVFYGRDGELEDDLMVAPGSRPSAVHFQVAGSERLEVDPSGGLDIVTGDGTLRQHAPLAYQDGPEGRSTVACRFRRTGPRSFGFELGAYDRSRAVVIDPVLVYSSGFGSSTISNFPNVGTSIAVDSAGNSYIAGNAFNNTILTTPGAFNTAHGQGFVTKLSPAGDVIQYSTYFAASVNGIYVDAQGNAYIAGGINFALPPARPPHRCLQSDGQFVCCEAQPSRRLSRLCHLHKQVEFAERQRIRNRSGRLRERLHHGLYSVHGFSKWTRANEGRR